MKVLARILLAFLLLSGAASAAEWDDPDWLAVQTTNILTEKYGFTLRTVTNYQSAVHYHLEKGNRVSGFTYVTCVIGLKMSSQENLYCFKP